MKTKRLYLGSPLLLSLFVEWLHEHPKLSIEIRNFRINLRLERMLSIKSITILQLLFLLLHLLMHFHSRRQLCFCIFNFSLSLDSVLSLFNFLLLCYSCFELDLNIFWYLTSFEWDMILYGEWYAYIFLIFLLLLCLLS